MSENIRRLVWDLESDGLLNTVTKIHCLVITDQETGEVTRFATGATDLRDGTVLEGLHYLFNKHNLEGYHIGGHNVINYDHAVVEKLYPGMFQVDESRVFDTLVMARLVWSHIKDIDAGLIKKGTLPGTLFGRHSLEAWGVRLGELKGDFAKKVKGEVEANVWEFFTEDMLNYCEQDTKVTLKLLEKILAKDYSQRAIDLEHGIQWVMSQMMRNGFVFDEQKAATLLVTLTAHQARLETTLMATFANWEVKMPDFIPARDNKTLGYTKGVAVPRVKTVMFNPQSHDHIANRLVALYGWVPVDFTPAGKPSVTEEVMKELTYPEAPLLTEYLMVSKRISQLSTGKAAWLQLSNKGVIHGSINPNGAITGRCTHSKPNISQVPNGHAAYGPECRALFTVPKGWLLCGADASGLELRCLAHYMARWDDGAYTTALLTGDIHTTNQLAAGLPTRDNAKTFILILPG